MYCFPVEFAATLNTTVLYVLVPEAIHDQPVFGHGWVIDVTECEYHTS